MSNSIPLWQVANSRAGDKGNRANISLICRDPADFAWLSREVTEEFVEALFADRQPSAVTRYALPKLAAFNFVIDDVLEGGVNASLGLDGHGKALSYMLLSAMVPWSGKP